MIEMIVRLALAILQPQAAASAPPNCYCNKPHTQDAVRCDTTRLRNGAILFYQYTCDSLWLTLRQPNGTTAVLHSQTDSDVFLLAYRLAYHLLAEYDKTLLFRYGCPANGPCEIVVVDKENGKKLLQFSDPDLLNHEATIPGGLPEGDHPDFLLFGGGDGKSMVLYYLNTWKKYRIPTQPLRLPSTPDCLLDGVTRTADRIVLTYLYDNNDTLTRYINLRRYLE